MSDDSKNYKIVLSAKISGPSIFSKAAKMIDDANKVLKT